MADSIFFALNENESFFDTRHIYFPVQYVKQLSVAICMAEDVWEKVWTKSLITSDYSLKYLDFLKYIDSDLKSGSKVIEAGCGTGQTLALFSTHHETFGIDMSPAALQHAKKNCRHVVLANIFDMPFQNNTFDFIYNSGVIEHFKDPTNVSAIKEMARILKPTGRLLVIVPNTYCLWYKVGKWVSVMMKNFEFGYEEDYSPTRLKNAIDRAGLIVEEIFGLQVLPPLATNDKELFSVTLRWRLGKIEKFFPAKQYYAYAIGVIASKTTSNLN